MEIVIAVFVGVWIVIASILAHKRIKREYGPYLDAEYGADAEITADRKEGVR
ncbi:MAG: hypothetical protein IJV59_03015 [Eubacterium sp.]|nr:hypothetical protein [Eubacterium sp.]